MNNQIHLKTVSLVTALLAVVMALLGLGLTALPASAANIPEAEITISTESVVTKQWDQVDVKCEWSVPDKSQPGDTFSVRLPAELRWFGDTTFDLKNPAGRTVATAAVNDDGLVVFTLTDFVASHPLNVGGKCFFTTQYSLEPTNGGTEELNFVVGDSVVRVPLTTEPCTEDCDPGVPTSVGKSMWWADPAQTKLESIFYMPPMAFETNDVVVTDIPAAGMEIDCSQVTPRVGKVVSGAGNIVEPFDNEQYPASIQCTPESLTVSWQGLPEGEHVELFVVTTVTDPSLDVYENNGTVNISGEQNPVGAEARRSIASGTGDGTVETTPTPSPSTAPATPTPTPTPSPSTAPATPTPSTSTATATPEPAPSTSTATATPEPAPSTSHPVVVVIPEEPAESTDEDNSEQLANTGAQGQGFIFIAAALLAVGSLLAFAGARKYGHRSH
ncbi:Ig-like domain-containing protein [Paenarthrobacter sp.]|uniref:Ig-like domain-containing protein n=1 Tax=Paenarthrobacter sp. TaxID=1931993 RepID=UPI0028110143|nr:Ig-like domain-containing protein [Paenarthrobacter sp.]